MSAEDDQWFHDFMVKADEAQKRLATLKAVSRDEQLGIGVWADHEGRLVKVDIPEKALRNSLESIARTVVANFEIARMKVCAEMLQTTAEVFPGSAELAEAREQLEETERSARRKLQKSNTWEHGEGQDYDEDEGWRGPIRQP